jgi:5-methylcytosine-specific restriction endonuclease McrA
MVEIPPGEDLGEDGGVARSTGRRSMKRALFEQQRGFCAYCGEQMHQGGHHPRLVTLDNIIPAREGGADDVSNMVAACYQCNRAKGCMTSAQLRQLANMIDYYAAQGVSPHVP